MRLSTPRENVLFVPLRKVLLTRSGWKDGNLRSSDHEAAGTGSIGSLEEGQEAADHTTRGGRGVEDQRAASPPIAGGVARKRGPCRDPRIAWPSVESPDRGADAPKSDEDSGREEVRGLWADAGQRTPSARSWDHDWPRGFTSTDDRSGPLEAPPAPARRSACVAAATEPVWRTGAVGHQHARLVGSERTRDLLDSPDRRCQQPDACAVCGARLDGGKYGDGARLGGAVRKNAGGLHGRQHALSQLGENATRSDTRRTGKPAFAAHAGWTGAARVEVGTDPGLFAGGQRTRGAQLPDRARSLGQGTARGGRSNAGTSQSSSGGDFLALVASALHGKTSPGRRCPSALEPATRPGCDFQSGRATPGAARLHLPVSRADLSDRAFLHRSGLTQCHAAPRATARGKFGGGLSRSVLALCCLLAAGADGTAGTEKRSCCDGPAACTQAPLDGWLRPASCATDLASEAIIGRGYFDAE